MKTHLLLAFSLCLSLSSCIGRMVVDKGGEFTLSKDNYSFIQEYESPENLKLSLSTVGGNIEVLGYEGNRVKVAFVVTRYDGEVVEMTLDELKKYASFVIRKEGSDLSIEVNEIFKRNMSVGFRVQTPIKTACNLSTSGGNVELENLTGDQEMQTSGGNISLSDVTGRSNAQTSGGNIHLNKLKGTTTVSTSGGNIEASHFQGDLTAETSGGNIRLDNHSGAADVATSGGNIHLENLSGSVSARTSGGNVSAELHKITGKLFMETSGGDIDCELPAGIGLNLNLDADNIQANLTDFQGSNSSGSISGKINGGGNLVQLSSPSGSIRLNFKKSSDNK